MAKEFIAKVMKKRYEKRRKKVVEFIQKFSEDHKIKIDDITNHDIDILIEEVEEVIYLNRDSFSDDHIAKLICLVNLLKIDK